MKAEIRSYASLLDLSRAAAELVSGLAEIIVRERDNFTLVLSGGNTPRLLYELLAQAPYRSKIDWKHTHLFWGDERCLPLDHPDSNFAMASQTLISRISIPLENVHRIPAETEPPEAAARHYEQILRDFFPPGSESETVPNFPTFDLVLLGLGEDGHTASLFPGDAALEYQTSWVAAVDGFKASPAVPRITLTLPAINGAKCVLFLASGAGKRQVLMEILDNPETTAYPAARVQPVGRLLWFIDETMT